MATAASVAALLKIIDKSPEVVTISAPDTELTVEIEEAKKYSGIVFKDNQQLKEDLYWIYKSRSYKIANKLTKLVKRK